MCSELLSKGYDLVLMFTHSVPLLKSLHRLPVRHHIIFKVCTITYEPLLCKQPSYIHSLFTAGRKRVLLCSSTFDLLVVPNGSTNIGTRAFSIVAPTFWNMFPSSVRSL